MTEPPVIQNPWQQLRRYTDARIGLGRAGTSQPTRHHLEFELDHARARDAVLRPLDWAPVREGLAELSVPVLELHSQATDRDSYLQRPDLGRRLDEGSLEKLQAWRADHNAPVEVCVVIGDGLSATAIEQQAVPMMRQLAKDLVDQCLQLDLICCASQARVALGDPVAEAVAARYLIVLIGERPGLSAADSLGIYYTYLARSGCSDADRNCISNVRPRGLSFAAASHSLLWLMRESHRLNTSGVALKDESADTLSLADDSQRNFLISQ